YNLSTYLVQSRLRALGEQARFLAESAAIDVQRAGGRDLEAVLARRQNSAARQFPGVSLAVLALDRPCRTAPGAPTRPDRVTARTLAVAGSWAHVDPPGAVPSWIGCTSLGGLFAYAYDKPGPPEAHLFGRGVALADSQKPELAVVADV